jgi:ketosteroid isomerase-like protein
MTERAMSRRHLFVAGGGAVAGAALIGCARGTGGGAERGPLLRTWYAAWEQTDWSPVDSLLADDFTFTSAAGDDHISKSTFRSRCWESQKGLIERFELEQVFGTGDEALVKYLCRTKNGHSFRNVEYFRFRGDKIAALECYFGEASSFPSAVSAKPT